MVLLHKTDWSEKSHSLSASTFMNKSIDTLGILPLRKHSSQFDKLHKHKYSSVSDFLIINKQKRAGKPSRPGDLVPQ